MRREKKIKSKRSINEVVISVKSSFNNTVINASDLAGNTVAWSSPGVVGYKGTRESTPHAAQIAAEDLIKKLKAMGVSTVSVKMQGPGAGREAVLRSMHVFNVKMISDVTPIPHNGVRLPKRRRA